MKSRPAGGLAFFKADCCDTDGNPPGEKPVPWATLVSQVMLMKPCLCSWLASCARRAAQMRRMSAASARRRTGMCAGGVLVLLFWVIDNIIEWRKNPELTRCKLHRIWKQTALPLSTADFGVMFWYTPEVIQAPCILLPAQRERESERPSSPFMSGSSLGQEKQKHKDKSKDRERRRVVTRVVQSEGQM